MLFSIHCPISCLNASSLAVPHSDRVTYIEMTISIQTELPVGLFSPFPNLDYLSLATNGLGQLAVGVLPPAPDLSVFL